MSNALILHDKLLSQYLWIFCDSWETIALQVGNMARLQRPFAIPLLGYIYEHEASKLSNLGNYKSQPHTINVQNKSLDPSLTANIQF